MPKSYLTNPVTEELIKEGIIVSYEQVEKRVIIQEDGQQYEEIAVTLRYKDPRKFKKAFPDAAAKYLQLFEGNTKAHMPFTFQLSLTV